MILFCGCTSGGPIVAEIGSDGKKTGRTTTPVRAPHAAAYQDVCYGKGMRVHVQTAGKRGDNCRCTVCGKTR